MSLLIAESGAGKTDWLHHDPERPDRPRLLRCPGLNPNAVPASRLEEQLRGSVLPWLDGAVVKAVFFFAAGLHDRVDQREAVTLNLRRFFPKIQTLKVASDLTAAAWAGLGQRAGLVAIIGTGSIAFRFDGREMTQRSGGLGYLLGDWGGAVHLGKLLLAAIMEQTLPRRLCRAWENFSGFPGRHIPTTLYGARDKVAVLSGTLPFLLQHRHEAEIRLLIGSALSTFLKRNLLALNPGPKETTVFVGGVVQLFPDLLEQEYKSLGLSNLTLLNEPPIHALARFICTTHFEKKPI